MSSADAKPAKPVSVIALLSGPDRPGLVSKVSTWIYERKGNILHADQHCDDSEKAFFQRIEWIPSDNEPPTTVARDFLFFVNDKLGMTARVALSTTRTPVALFVSTANHCFHDLVLRFQAGEMCGDIACVISNHEDMGPDCAHYGLPFYFTPITKESKEKVIARHLSIMLEHCVGVGVLARYMQILTADFLANAEIPFINIHHSFLPAFAGARPYHQAHARGVKLIGATAHYVTPNLDEGPIIAQDVSRVSHRHSPDDLLRRGRDLEKTVLAQALRWHLEHRILINGNKTMVFD